MNTLQEAESQKVEQAIVTIQQYMSNDRTFQEAFDKFRESSTFGPQLQAKVIAAFPAHD